MSTISHEIQRELTWLFSARYTLNPHEFRPDGACPKTLPRISVLRKADRYVVTLTWEFMEAVSSISACEANKLIRQQSQQLIDRALHIRYHTKKFIRRPLFVELEKSPQIEAVIVTVISASKLRCEPLKIFPWQSNHEFSCADTNVIKDAIRHNRMISAGRAPVM